MKKRILVVDDHALIRDVVTRTLTDAFELAVAADSEAALAQVAAAAPDLVLLDVDLGDGPDGLALCATLSQREPPIPVILLTSLDARADREAGLGAGARTYLTKPFSPLELLGEVRALLGAP